MNTREAHAWNAALQKADEVLRNYQNSLSNEQSRLALAGARVKIKELLKNRGMGTP